ncbi:MAG TPA: lysylphosphatidylglycerol synthase transmembrane domain-containing protein [Kofleriaceae bacterium]|nr:lysylphosphatidylglycerol synthase transmembrane domain-containing protein [Kofleriaceae bacterium]
MVRDHHERHLASHLFNLAVMVFGAGAVTWMMHQLGWAQFRAVVSGVGATFAIILTLDAAAILCDARALHTFMRPEARMISYWRVVAAQCSGRAVNIVTPFAALGEATKLTMLVIHAPRTRVVSAIVLANLAGLYVSLTVMLIGTPITLLAVDLPHPLKVTLALGLVVLVLLAIALGVLVHRGALSTLTALLHRVGLISATRLERWRDHLHDIDRQLAELYRTRSAGTWKGILWIVASRLVTWTSTMTLIRAVGAAISPQLVVGVLSVGVLISWISSVVPFGLGLADSGNYALFDLLGASGAHGAFVTMLNRVRSAVIALIGFAVMALVHAFDRISLARLHRRRHELHDPHAPPEPGAPGGPPGGPDLPPG